MLKGKLMTKPMTLSGIDFSPKQHIEIRDGQARLTGRNLKVKMVISRLFHGAGASVDEVMEQYNLTRAEVHAVITYYYDYREAIDRYFEQEDKMASESIPSVNDLQKHLKSN